MIVSVFQEMTDNLPHRIKNLGAILLNHPIFMTGNADGLLTPGQDIPLVIEEQGSARMGSLVNCDERFHPLTIADKGKTVHPIFLQIIPCFSRESGR